MRVFFFLVYVLLLCPKSSFADDDEEEAEEEDPFAKLDLQPAVHCSVYEPDVVEKANFVVSELQELSDCGIYRSLTLQSVVTASRARGIYHNNTYMTLELASPWFKSGKATEEFKTIVMCAWTCLGDDCNMAIDEFPIMSDDAIENFQSEAIERRRYKREREFERLLREGDDGYDLIEDNINEDQGDPLESAFIFRNSRDLLEDLKAATFHDDRWERADKIMAQRDKELQVYHLVDLAALDSKSLAFVANDDHELLERRGLANGLLQSRLKKNAINQQKRQQSGTPP